jgi:hypothetical protein
MDFHRHVTYQLKATRRESEFVVKKDLAVAAAVSDGRSVHFSLLETVAVVCAGGVTW